MLSSSFSFPWLEQNLDFYLREDGFERMLHGLSAHPTTPVKTALNWKSNLVVAGMPLFCHALNKYSKIDKDTQERLLSLEGKPISKSSQTIIELPFDSFIFLERTLLNLLHRLCAVATTTSSFVQKASSENIAILDTRKTTPGLRSLERYAVALAGGKNHRQDFTDCVMIKDNQKEFFGGLEAAWNFYHATKGFYQPIIVEIHSLEELKTALKVGATHLMLDNFSLENIRKAIGLKKPGVTYELSGGITQESIDHYLIQGVDAISLSSITFWPERVDISWKILS